MIEKLTPEQEAQLPIYRDKWLAIGLSTEPAVRDKAEAAINKSYMLAGLQPPKKIVWCGSPLSQGVTRAIIFDDKLWENLKIPDSVGASVWASVGASVRDSVGASVRDSVWASVGASVLDSVRDSVRDSVWASVRDSVWASVGASVLDSVRDSVWASVGASVLDSGYGQHDAAGLAFYEYFREILKLTSQTDKLSGLIEQAKYAGWYLPHQNICWVSERHNILNRDERGRLHSSSAPAVAYPDGWAIYAVHGVRVPEHVIMRPQEIKTDEIGKERNVEVRRVMLDRFGTSRYLTEIGAKPIHKDLRGELYRADVPNDEPLVMVKVKNGTVEPDGTVKDYWLRVPPTIETASAAVAWTFGQNEKEYAPVAES